MYSGTASSAHSPAKRRFTSVSQIASSIAGQLRSHHRHSRCTRNMVASGHGWRPGRPDTGQSGSINASSVLHGTTYSVSSGNTYRCMLPRCPRPSASPNVSVMVATSTWCSIFAQTEADLPRSSLLNQVSPVIAEEGCKICTAGEDFAVAARRIIPSPSNQSKAHPSHVILQSASPQLLRACSRRYSAEV